jgi:hypothetical protein
MPVNSHAVRSIGDKELLRQVIAVLGLRGQPSVSSDTHDQTDGDGNKDVDIDSDTDLHLLHYGNGLGDGGSCEFDESSSDAEARFMGMPFRSRFELVAAAVDMLGTLDVINYIVTIALYACATLMPIIHMTNTILFHYRVQ